MSLIGRFTRDEASKFVWSALMFAALVGLVFAFYAGGRAVEDERLASQDRAVNLVEEFIAPRLDRADLAAPLSGPTLQAMRGAVERSILSDPRVERLRIWAPNGSLLFSTAESDHPGSQAALNDDLVNQAWRGTIITRNDISDTGGPDDHERSLLRTYVPLASTAVVEVDETDAGTLGPVRTEWLSYQLLAGGLAILFLLVTALALRDPVERINVGVPFASSSVPSGFSLIDDDRLHAVREVYRLASERVERLEQKLSESEEARRRLEGDIQRALSKAATAAKRTAPPAPRPAAATVVPADAAPVPAAPPEPAVVKVPESEIVRSPLGDRWAAAPAGPLARATRDDTAVAPRTRRAKPVEKKTRRVLRRKKAAVPRPIRAEEATEKPRAEMKPQPKPKPPQQPRREPRPKPERAAKATPPPEEATPREVVRVGANARSSSTAPEIDIDDAKAHAAALETFIRLTESDRQPHESEEVDQGAVRAALARTAARKKPGGERLRPHDEPVQERQGGPPPDPRLT